MTRNFQLYFMGRLPQLLADSTAKGHTKMERSKILEQLYFSWQSGKSPGAESFRQTFITSLLENTLNGDTSSTSHYFTWIFIEGFSREEIALITSKSAEATAGETWACFEKAERHYRQVSGDDAPASCGETKFLLLDDWVQHLLDRDQEKELIDEINQCEPLQFGFELYLELRYGLVDAHILNRLQYGSSEKPDSADDFIRKVKSAIEKKS